MVKRNFVFVKDVEKVLSEGHLEMKVAKGTRFSPAAMDLVKEKGIRVSDLKNAPEKSEPLDAEIAAGSQEGSGERIAVASEGRVVRGTVCPFAGRSPYFLLFDGQGELQEVLENPYRKSPGAASQSVVGLLSRKDVSTFVAENFGPNMRRKLEAAGVAGVEFSGEVGEAVKAVLSGKGGGGPL